MGRGRRGDGWWSMVGVVAGLSLFVTGGCRNAPATEDRTAAVGQPSGPEPGVFSASRAFVDLEAIARIGPRETGSRGADRTRRLLRRELEELGARVDERVFEVERPSRELVPLRHVRGVLDGDSPDVLLLMARYDTPSGRGRESLYANASASGPALLLEVGRALAHRPRPFTVWLIFLDGDAVDSPPGAEASAGEARQGSEAMASWLAADGQIQRIRLAVYFERIASPGLEVARDLRSHRIYREVFWQSARDLGFSGVFPSEGPLESPEAGHLAFLGHGLRRVVAIVEAEPSALLASDSDPEEADPDTPASCSRESLEAVGVVSVEALGRIGERLQKIDRFARPEPPSVAPVP